MKNTKHSRKQNQIVENQEKKQTIDKDPQVIWN